MHLNYPETNSSLPAIPGKIVFNRTDPWCQKGWGLLIWGIIT